MRLKHVVAAAAVAALSTATFANDVTEPGPALVNGSAGFTITHVDSNPFTDMITFANAGAVQASASLITINLGGGHNIDFSSVKLNGNDLTLSSAGPADFAYTSAPLNLNGNLVLEVMGTTDAGGGRNATYSGTMNVTAVPEPETYALMLAGLGAIGFMARRRRGA